MDISKFFVNAKNEVKAKKTIGVLCGLELLIIIPVVIIRNQPVDPSVRDLVIALATLIWGVWGASEYAERKVEAAKTGGQNDRRKSEQNG